MDGKITALSKTVASNKAELEGSIIDLTSTVTSNTSDISELQITVASNVSKINSLSGTVSANTAAISNINNITSASATINSNVGTPTVTVSYTGETSNKKLNFEFKNLKGDPGATGVGISSVKQTTTSTVDEGENKITVTLTNNTSSVFTVKNGSKGSTGVGISKISKSGETVTVIYTDPSKTSDSFTVKDGAPGTNVTITSISQNKTAGSYSTVSFSTGNKLDIYNGENGAKGSDGYSTYYTANTYASDHKTISQGVVTKPSERSIQIGDFILASNGNMFRVTGAGPNLSVDYITSIKGEPGPKGDNGTSVNIKETLNETLDLKNKQDGAVNGDGYLIDGYLYVYTGSGQTYGFENVGEIKGPQGETGPQGPEGPAGTSVAVSTVTSNTGDGEINTVTFTDGKTLKVKNGEGGRGITSISKASGSGKPETTDVYTITYTDNTTTSFSVVHGNNGYSVSSVVCVDKDGGETTTSISHGSEKINYYRIKDENDEFLGGTIAVRDGKDGTNVTITSVSQNNNAGESSTVTFSDGKSLSIKNGINGSNGVSVSSIVCVSSDNGTITGNVSKEDGVTNYYRIKDSDGNFLGGTIAVKNGTTGSGGSGSYTNAFNSVTINGGDTIYAEDYQNIIIEAGNNIKINSNDNRIVISSTSTSVENEVYYKDILEAPLTMDDSGVLDIVDDSGYIIAKIDSDGITTTKVKAKNGFYQTSDETLKDFHDSIEVDFNALKSIPKSYYTWRGEDVKQIGTSAQKVHEIYPEIVSLDEKTGKLTLDYAKLSIVALKAIDLLHEENESLKLEIETLHNEMDKIKSHLGL